MCGISETKRVNVGSLETTGSQVTEALCYFVPLQGKMESENIFLFILLIPESQEAVGSSYMIDQVSLLLIIGS